MKAQSPEQAQAAIDRIAAAKTGAPPPTQAAAVPGPGLPAPPPQGGKPPEAPTTPIEAAVAQGAPQTEEDRSAEMPVVYQVPFGEGDQRNLTPDQIKGTFERYRDLNFKHQQMAPVMRMAEDVMSKNPGMTADQFVSGLLNLANSKQEFGAEKDGTNDDPKRSKPGAPSIDPDELAQWEEKNAASLPPGYKEMLGQQSTLQQQLEQTQAMLQQVVGRSQGVADAARASNEDARAQVMDATKKSISNNLNQAQRQLGLPDERAKDFEAFFAERGYTLDDFLDPQLTVRIMQDFKHEMDGPEMDRMRQIAQRRQAFTGAMEPAPGSGGQPGGAPQDPANDHIARLTSQAIQQRMGNA